MRFTLVRHGEVEEPSPGLMHTGHDDPQLTQHGRRQSAALAHQLFEDLDQGKTFHALYTSPLRAARLTAEALAAVLDIGDPEVVPELATLTPEVLPPDGNTEALEAIQERAWGFIQARRQELDQAANVLLVTHELTIRTVVCKALSMPLAEMGRFEIEPGSLTTIEFRSQPRERTLIASLNEVCHLERAASS